MAPSGGRSQFVQRMAKAADNVAAVAGLLEQVAVVFHQLVIVAGWVVLLYGSVALLFQPHPQLEHLVVPGAGALAVVQGRITAWLARRVEAAGARLVNEPQTKVDPVDAVESKLASPPIGDAREISASDAGRAALRSCLDGLRLGDNKRPQTGTTSPADDPRQEP